MYLLNKFEALGTALWIEIFQELTSESEIKYRDQIIEIIENFENNYSRFKVESAISKLNLERNLQNPSTELIDILNLALEYEKKTEGLFDIKIAHILGNLGYGSQYNFTDDKIPEQIIISKNEIKLIGNFAIDLGGIGKSYLICKISNFLEKNLKLKYYLINFGGDIYATSNQGKKIEISLEDPINQENYFATVSLFNSSVCCSSPFKRVWKHNDKIKTHIIDKNLNQARFSAYVFGPDVVSCDIYATCLCLHPNLEINDINIGYLILDENSQIIGVK